MADRPAALVEHKCCSRLGQRIAGMRKHLVHVGRAYSGRSLFQRSPPLIDAPHTRSRSIQRSWLRRLRGDLHQCYRAIYAYLLSPMVSDCTLVSAGPTLHPVVCDAQPCTLRCAGGCSALVVLRRLVYGVGDMVTRKAASAASCAFPSKCDEPPA